MSALGDVSTGKDEEDQFKANKEAIISAKTLKNSNTSGIISTEAYHDKDHTLTEDIFDAYNETFIPSNVLGGNISKKSDDLSVETSMPTEQYNSIDSKKITDILVNTSIHINTNDLILITRTDSHSLKNSDNKIESLKIQDSEIMEHNVSHTVINSKNSEDFCIVAITDVSQDTLDSEIINEYQGLGPSKPQYPNKSQENILDVEIYSKDIDVNLPKIPKFDNIPLLESFNVDAPRLQDVEILQSLLDEPNCGTEKLNSPKTSNLDNTDISVRDLKDTELVKSRCTLLNQDATKDEVMFEIETSGTNIPKQLGNICDFNILDDEAGSDLKDNNQLQIATSNAINVEVAPDSNLIPVHNSKDNIDETNYENSEDICTVDSVAISQDILDSETICEHSSLDPSKSLYSVISQENIPDVEVNSKDIYVSPPKILKSDNNPVLENVSEDSPKLQNSGRSQKNILDVEPDPETQELSSLNLDISVGKFKDTELNSINQVATMDKAILEAEKFTTDIPKQSENISDNNIIDDKAGLTNNNQTEIATSNAVKFEISCNSNLEPKNNNKDNINGITDNVNKIAKADTSMHIDHLTNTHLDDSSLHFHNLHRPDVMLEIPTHGLIELDDILDSPNNGMVDGESPNISKDDDAVPGNMVDDNVNIITTLDIDYGNVKEVTIDKNNSEEGSTKQFDPIPSVSCAINEPQPSTSTSHKLFPDRCDDLPKTFDSLDLLVESQRVRKDGDDDDGNGVNEDDEFEHNESSNQMTAEHSEDSNVHHSETETARNEQEKEAKEVGEEKVSNISENDLDQFTEEIALEIQEHGLSSCNIGVVVEEGESVKCQENINNRTDFDKVDDSKLVSPVPELIVPDGNIQKEKDDPVMNTNKENDEPVILEIEKIYTFIPNEESQNGIDNTVEYIENSEKGKDFMVNLNDNSEKEKDETLILIENLEKKNGDVTMFNNSVDEVESDISLTNKHEKNYNDIIENGNKKDDVSIKQAETAIIDGTPIQSHSSVTLRDDVAEESSAIPIFNLSDSDNEDVDQEIIQLKKNNTVGKTAAEVSTAVDPLITSKDIPSFAVSKNQEKKLNQNVVNIVDLQETSSEDDVQDTDQIPPFLLKMINDEDSQNSSNETTINLPTDIKVKSSSCGGIMKTHENIVISRVRKPSQQKSVPRLNTSEISIKTSSGSEQTLIIPETQMQTPPNELEIETQPTAIYNIDSDEDDSEEQHKLKKKARKCINNSCSSGSTLYMIADKEIAKYYDASKKRKPLVCEICAEAVVIRKKSLIAGIKDMIPLTQLDMSNTGYDDVEVLDSESEDEEPHPQEEQIKETIGEETAKFLEENLAEILNSTWKKYNLDERLKVTQGELHNEIAKLEIESKEINDMLIECQHMTDKLRTDFYGTFEPRIQHEPPFLIYETPEFRYCGPEMESPVPPAVSKNRQITKRKMSASNANPAPAKRPAVIALGYAPLHDPRLKVQETKIITNEDDDKDVSVVKLSAESPPPELPPSGELIRTPLRTDMPVYAMKNAYGTWLKGKITEIMPKGTNPFTLCRVQFDHITKNHSKILPARCIAYDGPPNVRMTIGTRLIALFKDSNKRESYSSGVVAEAPTPVNNFRYLVFFDDGYAQYVNHQFTRLVCECSPQVWEEVHPYSRDFVKEYLMAFPERPMVRLRQGQNFKTEWNGKWLASRVVKVDASLVQVAFIADGRREWIYRGSTRLAPLYMELKAAERQRPRVQGSRGRQQLRTNMPYVEYTRAEEQGTDLPAANTVSLLQQDEEGRRQRAVAKKSTTSGSSGMLQIGSGLQPVGGKAGQDTAGSVISRVVYYTPKNAVKPAKLVPHTCSPQCKRTVLSLDDLRTYNPLAKPLLSGWERQTIRYKYMKEVMYRAPCGRRLRNIKELHRYLQVIDSELSVDLFDFNSTIHCLAEFQINKCLSGKKDLSQGKENVPVPCVNYYDQTLPEFCLYNTERTPTSGVPLNLDPEFLCGCDCIDDCEDKTKCACWKMTLEGARTIGLDTSNVGYVYKRLPEPLPSGIYECNSRCKCKQTCLNRVAQHPLQLKLQVFKTLNRGWGIRALNDVPKGAFLCVYAGNLLTDATANLDGLNEGDEYLAELDYIEVVEQMKEGYEADIPETEKNLDGEQTDSTKQEESPEQSSSSSEEEETSNNDKDDDFMPGHIEPSEVTKFNKHLRKRSRDEEAKDKESKDKTDNEFITISDDEEVREPSRFAAQPGMGGNEFISKYKSVRTLFGEDEACYIMDAKVQGNIGRYLNHSCSPNVFVQNVFVDTHDPRFPWVAFFALSDIKAGTELTWNYNYDVGSVPGKVLYCYCQAPNCRGRLL